MHKYMLLHVLKNYPFHFLNWSLVPILLHLWQVFKLNQCASVCEKQSQLSALRTYGRLYEMEVEAKEGV